jgi:hypothetical protein
VDDATRRRLTADCSQCLALCCVGPGFAASADFAITKPPGRPCPNLRPDFGCGIHDRLRPNGFGGCASYDCFGAGQRVCQELFPGQDWRDSSTGTAMFAALGVLRQLHELLWYLGEALARSPDDGDLRAGLVARRDDVEALAALPAARLTVAVARAQRSAVGPLLTRASGSVRASAPHGTWPPGTDRKATDGNAERGTALDRTGADLTAARLRGADLRAVGLRGAVLIGADLREADLRRADLLGADLRAADLRGADLREVIFLVQSQLESAVGDEATRIPQALARPDHWAAQEPAAGPVRRRSPHR